MSSASDSIQNRIWMQRIRWTILIVFAWSLPVSLFGMQAGVVSGILWLVVVSILLRGKNLTKTPLDRAILVMGIAIGLSLLFVPDGLVSFQGATSFWVASSYYVTWYFLDSETLLRRSVWGIILLACLVSVFAVYQSVTGSYPLGSVMHPQVEVLLKPVPGMDEWVGGVGLFFSRLTLAHVLLFPFCWAVALLLEPLTARTKLFLVLTLVCMLAGLLYTWTRAALLVACLVALGLVLSRLRARWGFKIGAIAGLLVLTLSVCALFPKMRNRMLDSFAGGRDWGRLTLWQTALDMASDNPLTGYGYGNFQRIATVRINERMQQMKKSRFPAIIAWAHSNLLTFLAETGLMGAFAFCFLFVLYFRNIAKTLKKIRHDKPLLRGFVRGSIGAVCAFLAVGCFHDTFFDGEVVFTLWFAMAASLACDRLQLPREMEKRC